MCKSIEKDNSKYKTKERYDINAIKHMISYLTRASGEINRFFSESIRVTSNAIKVCNSMYDKALAIGANSVSWDR